MGLLLTKTVHQKKKKQKQGSFINKSLFSCGYEAKKSHIIKDRTDLYPIKNEKWPYPVIPLDMATITRYNASTVCFAKKSSKLTRAAFLTCSLRDSQLVASLQGSKLTDGNTFFCEKNEALWTYQNLSYTSSYRRILTDCSLATSSQSGSWRK